MVGVADAPLPVRGRDRPTSATPRSPKAGCGSTGVTRNNLHDLDVAFPLGVLTTVTGVSGSGKSSLVSQALVELVGRTSGPRRCRSRRKPDEELERAAPTRPAGALPAAWSDLTRLVRVDQKPIGRTPRSNLATYTGLFDHVRKLFAATKAAKARQVRRRPLLVQRRQGPLRAPAPARAS